MTKKFTWEQQIYSEKVIDYYAYYGKEELGYIEFYPKWKKWVWNQGEDIIMSHSCLKKVLKKLEEIGGENANT